MKKTWLVALAGVAGIALAIGAVACSSSNDNKKDNTPQATEANMTPKATQADMTPGGSTTPNGTQQVAAPINVTIKEVGGSGVSGTATISPTADGTDVVVNITAGLEPGTHLSHIHHGACSDPTGPIHVNLTSIDAAADGSGTASTTNPADSAGVAPPFSHWLAKAHYVAVHALDGTVVGCGDVAA